MISIISELRIDTTLSLARNFEISHTLKMLDTQDYEKLKKCHKGLILLNISCNKKTVNNEICKVDSGIEKLNVLISKMSDFLEFF